MYVWGCGKVEMCKGVQVPKEVRRRADPLELVLNWLWAHLTGVLRNELHSLARAAKTRYARAAKTRYAGQLSSPMGVNCIQAYCVEQ